MIPTKTIKEEIEEEFRKAGLRKNLGEGWTPIDRVVKAWREELKARLEN